MSTKTRSNESGDHQASGAPGGGGAAAQRRELILMLRELVGLPALWGSAAARPVVERARELIARAERCWGEE